LVWSFLLAVMAKSFTKNDTKMQNIKNPRNHGVLIKLLELLGDDDSGNVMDDFTTKMLPRVNHGKFVKQ